MASSEIVPGGWTLLSESMPVGISGGGGDDESIRGRLRFVELDGDVEDEGLRGGWSLGPFSSGLAKATRITCESCGTVSRLSQSDILVGVDTVEQLGELGIEKYA